MISSTDAKVDNNIRFTSVFVTWKIVNSLVLLPYEVFAAQLCVNLRGLRSSCVSSEHTGQSADKIERFEPAEFRTCTLPLAYIRCPNMLSIRDLLSLKVLIKVTSSRNFNSGPSEKNVFNV